MIQNFVLRKALIQFLTQEVNKIVIILRGAIFEWLNQMTHNLEVVGSVCIMECVRSKKLF